VTYDLTGLPPTPEEVQAFVADSSPNAYEKVVDRLLADIGDPGGVDPPQLQIVCDYLYDSRDEKCVISLDAYDRLGGAAKILAGYLERVLRRFNADDLLATKKILTTLISEDGQRLVLKARDVEARIGKCADDPATKLLIEELVAARVLRRRRQDGDHPHRQQKTNALHVTFLQTLFPLCAGGRVNGVANQVPFAWPLENMQLRSRPHDAYG